MIERMYGAILSSCAIRWAWLSRWLRGNQYGIVYRAWHPRVIAAGGLVHFHKVGLLGMPSASGLNLSDSDKRYNWLEPHHIGLVQWRMAHGNLELQDLFSISVGQAIKTDAVGNTPDGGAVSVRMCMLEMQEDFPRFCQQALGRMLLNEQGPSTRQAFRPCVDGQNQ